MTNPFKNRVPSVSGPAPDMMPVTPADGADLSTVAVSLYVETGGTVVFTSAAGMVRTVNVADHSYLLVGVIKVWATGTTASGIHACILG
jgi:hypothetical protein